MADENQQLTVTIKTVADTSGAQQVSQSLQKVQQQAQQTGEQGAQVANQLVRSLVQQHGASQESFQRAVQSVQQSTGIRPTITPASLGITTQTVQAAGQVAQQTERAAQSSRGLSSGLQEVARVGAGLFGIGLGLNLAANVAEKLHAALVSVVTAEVQLEYAARGVNATYGQRAGGQFAAGAAAFVANPATRGTQAEFLQAVQSAAPLQQRLGLSTGQIDQATTAAGKLARVFDTDLAPAQRAVSEAIAGNTAALEPFGITLTDQYGRITGLGQTYEQLATSTSKAEASQKLLAIVLGDVDKVNSNAAGSTDELATAMDRLGKASDAARTNLGKLAAPAVAAAVQNVTPAIEHPEAALPLLGAAPPLALPVEIATQTAPAIQDFLTQQQRLRDVAHVQGLPGGAGIDLRTHELVSAADVNQRLSDAIARQRQAAEDDLEYTKGLADAQAAAGASAEAAATAQKNLATETSALAGAISGTLTPALQHLGAIQTAIGGFGAVGGALQGPAGTLLSEQARGQLAAVTAAQQTLQVGAQQTALTAPEIQQAIEQARQANPAEFARRQTGAGAGVLAQQTAGFFADRATTEANAQLQRIQITQDERRLAVQDQVVNAKRRELELAGQLSVVTLAQHAIQAQATLASGRLQSIQIAESDRRLQYADQQADLQKESIQLQQQMSPLLLQQANLQDRMALASRDNLDIRKQLISAEQAALPSEGALSELNYAQQRIQLQAQVRQAAAIRGQSTAGMPSFAELTQGFVQGELNRPAVELQALDARQQVARAQQASTAAGLGQQMTQTDLEAQARAIQDQLLPLQEAQRAEQARSEALQQMLDLLDLEDTKAKRAAESAVNLAQQQLLAINQTLVPLQLQSEFAQAASDAIQRSLDLLNLGDAPAQAFWQTMVDGAAQLKLDSEDAARAASDFSAGLNLGVDPAEKIRASLQQGADALLSINNLNNGAGGVGITPYGPSLGGPGGGVNLGGITVNIGGGGNTEATVDAALAQFELQFRQALRASGSAAPPISSSLVGTRRG